MTASNWIAVVAIVVTVGLAATAWMSATFMRIGKVLEEMKQISVNVGTLAAAFDSQEKKIDSHGTRIAVLEANHANKTRTMAH